MSVTPDEAIKILETNLYGTPEDLEEYGAYKYSEAIREAIRALKRVVADTISREEALKEMQNYYDDCAKTSEYTRLGFETAMNVIKGLPPTTPERQKGKWILTQRGKHVDITCSCCGSIGVESYAYNYSVDDLPEYEAREFVENSRMYFCKVCGADMREGLSE